MTDMSTFTNSASATVRQLTPALAQNVQALTDVEASLGTQSFTPKTDAEVVRTAQASEDAEVKALVEKVEAAQTRLRNAKDRLREAVDPKPQVNDDDVNKLKSEKREIRKNLRAMYTAVAQVANLEGDTDAAQAALEALEALTPKQNPSAVASKSAARVWLREHGFEVGDRGRIPQELMDKVPAEVLA